MTDQTNDELNEAIADAELNQVINEHFGWHFYMGEPKRIHGRTPPVTHKPLNYAGSLEAMHEAEQTLSDEERDAYYLTLLDICCEFPGTHTYSATARQRAQAFVRTIAARAEREAKP